MKFLSKKTYLTYDDVLLAPGKSLPSRSEVILPNIIIPAPMDTVSGEKLVEKQLSLGGVGILHRYLDEKTKLKFLKENQTSRTKYCFISVGLNENEIFNLFEEGCDNFCIDIANGWNSRALKIIKSLSRCDCKVIAGNVATWEGYKAVAEAGAHYIRVGIGGGSLCTTRLVTGIGIPQFSAIYDIAKKKHKFPGVKLIADGGIRHSGDIVKALAVGADYVMAGQLFAGTDEAPGKEENGKKVYRGMASLDAQVNAYGVEPIAPEGASTFVSKKGPYENVLKGLLMGVKSGMSYLNARTLSELRKNARFIKISDNTLIENHPHAII